MAPIQEDILDDFFEQLRNSASIDEEHVQALRALFSTGGKLKADALVAIYTEPRKDGAT